MVSAVSKQQLAQQAPSLVLHTHTQYARSGTQREHSVNNVHTACESTLQVLPDLRERHHHLILKSQSEMIRAMMLEDSP